MEWSRDFTALVLRFALHVSRIDGVSLDQALLRGTPLYPNFKLGTAFDPTEPLWQEFLAGYHAASDQLEWTHAFYLAHARQYPPHPHGCFRYHYHPETRTAGLHFGNLDTSGLGALSRERRCARLYELRAMFTDLRRSHPEAEMFAGGSWLYNLPAYRALFPPEYIATATPTTPGFTFYDVWGQFLDSVWRLRPAPSREFVARMEKATCHDDLAVSFPLLPLLVARADSILLRVPRCAFRSRVTRRALCPVTLPFSPRYTSEVRRGEYAIGARGVGPTRVDRCDGAQPA